MQETIEKMVEKAIRGGWLKERAPNAIPIEMPPGKTTNSIQIVFGNGSFEDGFGKILSLSDLLLNHPFMEAVFGKKCIEFKDFTYMEDRVCTFSVSCKTCEYYAPINTMLEAAKLPTDKERVEYIKGILND